MKSGGEEFIGRTYSRSREGAWIEMPMSVLNLVPLMVAPARERELKYPRSRQRSSVRLGRSREGAWIEMVASAKLLDLPRRRSREGAWIEIVFVGRNTASVSVAPARERGLKCKKNHCK